MGRGARGENAHSQTRSNLGPRVTSLLTGDALLVAEALGKGEVFIVGGAVRDSALHKKAEDVDLLVSGLGAFEVERALLKLPGQLDCTGRDFAVFRYNGEVEVALPRLERSTGEGHGDFKITTSPEVSVEDDLARRDFSANAIAVCVSSNEIIDPYNGLDDIKNNKLRVLDDRSLAEDPLRIIRALVINGRHGLEPDQNTLSLMKESAPQLHKISPERVRSELDKVFASKNPDKAISLARETGVLAQILPEVDACFGFNQNNPHHSKELGDHLLATLAKVSEISSDRDLRLAALLHDIGKPSSVFDKNGVSHYYQATTAKGEIVGKDHNLVGGTMAEEIMTRLKYPTARKDRVVRLVNNHQWADFQTERGARRFLARVGGDCDDLLLLRIGDKNRSVKQQQDLITSVREKGQATSHSNLAISGNDLIEIGFKPDKRLGDCLASLLRQVVDNPALNNKKDLLRLAQQIN